MVERGMSGHEHETYRIPYRFTLLAEHLPKVHYAKDMTYFVHIETEGLSDSASRFQMTEVADRDKLVGYSVILDLPIGYDYKFCYVGEDGEIGDAFWIPEKGAARIFSDCSVFSEISTNLEYED